MRRKKKEVSVEAGAWAQHILKHLSLAPLLSWRIQGCSSPAVGGAAGAVSRERAMGQSAGTPYLQQPVLLGSWGWLVAGVVCPAYPLQISIAFLALRTETYVICSLKPDLHVLLAVGKQGCPGCCVSQDQRCPVLLQPGGWRGTLGSGGRQGTSCLR